MRPAAIASSLALVIAAGVIVVGHGLVLADIDPGDLLDPNLARAIAAPLELRLWTALAAACAVLAVAQRLWLGSRTADALAILLVGASCSGRLALVPRVHAAWARVDLVAGRPVAALERAQTLAEVESGLLTVILGLLVAVAALTVRHARRPARAT